MLDDTKERRVGGPVREARKREWKSGFGFLSDKQTSRDAGKAGMILFE